MIAVVFALEFESSYFKAHAKSSPLTEIWLLGLTGRHSGPAMEKRIREEKGPLPKLVISAGFAGGLQPGQAIGDLMIGENFSDPAILDRLKTGPDWKRGKLFTAEEMAETAETKHRLGRETGALAVDIETAHVHAVCQKWNLPMLSVRCISDLVDDTLPVPAPLLLNPDTGRPDPFGLFKYFVTHPQCIPGFNALIKNARTAQARIASGLKEITDQLG